MFGLILLLTYLNMQVNLSKLLSTFMQLTELCRAQAGILMMLKLLQDLLFSIILKIGKTDLEIGHLKEAHGKLAHPPVVLGLLITGKMCGNCIKWKLCWNCIFKINKSNLYCSIMLHKTHVYDFGIGIVLVVMIMEMFKLKWLVQTIGLKFLPDYTNTGSNIWTYPSIDLSEYAGQSVQIAFYF